MYLYICSIFLVLSSLHWTSRSQILKAARWCTISDEEHQKCDDLITAISLRRMQDDTYEFDMRGYSELPELECVQGNDRFACMEMIYAYDADLIQLSPGMGYTAGQYFTMMPLMAERYETGAGQTGLTFKAVAVVKKDKPYININNLSGKKACHPAVGDAAGWTFPVSTLIEMGIMPITECNVPVKSAAAFFGDMCAPNGLARFYNPFGNNPISVCKQCIGPYEDYCTGRDPYAGYFGAFDCMNSGAGDVAFIRDTTLFEALVNNTSGVTMEDFELLCTDGSRRSTAQSDTCHWGEIASHIIMTSAIHDSSLRQDYKDLLKLIDHDFGTNGAFKNIFDLYSSSKYGKHELMFTDETKELLDVGLIDGGERDTYYSWVGEEFTRRMDILNTCPLQQARWCVISRYEMTKCENMIMAFAAKGLKPDLNCMLGSSIRNCMDMIKTGDADMMALDAADVFIAGKYYNLVPIASEDYSGYDAQTYYAVAVARKVDSYLTIFNLKARRSCHAGVMTAAGWVQPVDKLIETGQIHVSDGNVYKSVGQLFSKSCVPGVLNSYYNPHGTNPINLCEACAAGGPDRCLRNDEELYYGNSGAFRCLTEEGGDIAFVKHTTVRENTGGRNPADWARNRRSDDYQLLCNDGTRRAIDDWQDCNMGEVPANAIVTAGFKTDREREIYWTLLNYAQQFFASDNSNDFSMFTSLLDHKDLIFQDSTVRLIAVEPDNQDYKKYLQLRFLRAMDRLESMDFITAGASTAYASIVTFISVALAVLFLQ